MLIYLSLSWGMNHPEKELPLALWLQLHCTSLLEKILLGMASINPTGTDREDYQSEWQCNTQ